MIKTNKKIKSESLNNNNKKFLYHVLDNKGATRRLFNGDLLAAVIGAVIAESINDAMMQVNQAFGNDASLTVLRIKEIN